MRLSSKQRSSQSRIRRNIKWRWVIKGTRAKSSQAETKTFSNRIATSRCTKCKTCLKPSRVGRDQAQPSCRDHPTVTRTWASTTTNSKRTFRAVRRGGSKSFKTKAVCSKTSFSQEDRISNLITIWIRSRCSCIPVTSLKSIRTTTIRRISHWTYPPIWQGTSHSNNCKFTKFLQANRWTSKRFHPSGRT